MRLPFRVFALIVLALAANSLRAADQFELDGPVAIQHVTLVPAPGEKVEDATVLMENGRIRSVGKTVALPTGTRVLDGAGLFAYAGFIDGFARLGLVDQRSTPQQERRYEDDFPSISEGPLVETVAANRNGIFAQRSVEDELDMQARGMGEAHNGGWTAALLAPHRAILGGQTALIQLGEKPLRRSIVKIAAGMAASFETPRRTIRERGSYPGTLLGVIAHLRQTFFDAQWYRDLQTWVKQHPADAAELPDDPDLQALQAVIGGQSRVLFEAGTADEIGRVLTLAKELGFKPVIVGGREAWQMADALKAADVPVILSLRLSPKPGKYKIDANELRTPPDETMTFAEAWDKRPFEPKAAYDAAKKQRDELLKNAQMLEKAGVKWCFTSLDLKKPSDALMSLHEIMHAGLSADAALRGLTASAASIIGVDDLGAVQPGKRANLTILSEELGKKDAKVRWVFVDGKQFEVEQVKKKKGKAEKEEEKDDEEKEEPGEKPHSRREDVTERTGGTTQPAPARKPEKPAAETTLTSQPATASAPATQSQPTSEPAPTPWDDLLLHEPNWPFETEASRDPGVHTSGSVLLKNAYVIPVSGPDQPQTDILVTNGKIAAIGKGLTAPTGATAWDLSGLCVMPGVIDPHSHIAIESVNEYTASVTPEVRVGDVLMHDDRDIYSALAGGVTTIHTMHGSSNTIGGQCILIKLRYGKTAAELPIPMDHGSVKFALGENVIRPGKGGGRRFGADDPRRFPGTRMGVESTIRRAFDAAREYELKRLDQEKATAGKQAIKPLRRDLRLEALSDILRGNIWIQMHCYRSDEILRILATTEEYGIRIGGLHHVLDGYRIAPEIARYGCGTATFADWWAYKVEAYEAIPQNAGMLWKAGVNSCLKSDSQELMRHMPFEAAKSMKFGGLTPTEALRSVTLGPANMFGIQDRVGSIEVGKDADLCVWNGHPLDTFARVLLTLVDGECYFRDPGFDPAKGGTPALPLKKFEAPKPAPPAVTDKKTTPGLYAIVNGDVYTMETPGATKATIIVRNGRIEALGPDVKAPADAAIIDAAGKRVYPGLINAATEVGLFEVGQEEVTVDTRENGTFQPDITAVSAENPHSAMIEVARAEGITTVLVLPSGGPISGQAGLLDLNGWTMPEMLRDAKVALTVNLPSVPPKSIIDEPRKRPFPDEDEEPREEEPRETEVRKRMKRIERYFEDARRYNELRPVNSKTPMDQFKVPFDSRYEAMRPYLRGEKPVLFNADSYKQIMEAIMFADRLKLKPVIVGGRDAWKLTDVLAKRSIPVVYTGVWSMPADANGVPREGETWDANYRAAAALAKAGVKFCFAHRTSDLAKLLPVEAGFAVGFGLPEDDAVRAVTCWPAEILGVNKELGTLAPGKVANIIICTDHPGQATNVVTNELIRGVPVSLESKHTREAAKFAARPAPTLPPKPTDLKGAKDESHAPK